MRARQVFEYALVELNKKGAPSLILADYNYFINKAIGQYINRMYNAYEVNQQKTDDVRVLKSSAVLTPIASDSWSGSSLLSNTYEVDLPDDYLHILNCIVEYDVKQKYLCYAENTKYQHRAVRATSDMISGVMHNYYFKPSYKNPYYYINNVNTSNVFPTTDTQEPVQDPLLPNEATKRYGNSSKVRMEIRYGKDSTTFELSKIYIDYIKVPQFIELSQIEIDEVEDTSQVLEFPDYVCQEIINELVKLLLENGSDPRLQSFIPINQSIAMPGQERK